MKKSKKKGIIGSNRGITLIALVITIIVLLILAGVSLNLIRGNDGILKKATSAVDLNNEMTAREQAELVVAEKLIEFYDKRYVENDYVRMKKEYIVEKLKDGVITNHYFVETTVDENIYVFEGSDNLGKVIALGTVEEDGSIKWDNLRESIIVSNIQLTLENGTEPKDYSQEIGTALIVNFEARIEDGTITGIEPNLPYKTTGTEMKKEFTITAEGGEKQYSKTITIPLNKKYVLKEPEIIPSTTEWTKDSVSVEVNFGNVNNTYKKEISIDGGVSYSTYKGAVKVEKNTIVKARILGEGGIEIESELSIKNIDKINPNEFTPTISENVSPTQFTINADAKDGDETEEFGCSGIMGYQYFVYQGNELISQSEIISENSWIASNLTAGEKYRIYVEAYDKAGNKIKRNK